jgi:hypothetical protein
LIPSHTVIFVLGEYSNSFKWNAYGPNFLMWCFSNHAATP